MVEWLQMVKRIGLLKRINSRTLLLLASNRFFYLILAIVILQALWFALSIKMGLYDEGRHINAIRYFMEDWNPFGMQDEKWDFLGDLTRDGSYLFYYLLGMVGRLVSVVSSSDYVFIVSLRITVLAIFVAGMVIYRKLLLELGLGKAITNASLLVVVLFPMIAPLPGVVNYDTAVFTFAAIMLLFAVRIIKNNDSQTVYNTVLFLLAGMGGSLMKTQFVALFIPVLFCIAITLVRRYNKKRAKLKTDLEKFGVKKIPSSLLVVALLLMTVLFLERPVYSFVMYQKIAPQSACEEILESKERCLKNPVAQRNADLKEARGAFKPHSPYDYLFNRWIPVMTSTLLIVIGSEGVNTLFFVQVVFSTFIFLGMILILVNLRRILENRLLTVMLITSVSYVVILFLTHYKIYIELGAPVATNGRYLLPILPLLVALAVVSFTQTFTRNLRLKIQPIMVTMLVIALTQGAGIGTAVIKLGGGFYFENGPLNPVNSELSEVGKRLILEKNPFRRF